eukprot:TRINITY_DN2161_c0_g2_i3.p3 TRINITY_DN2161_c0_g2~~TRINITY_DN2161_c0_g2_i3.p3  ORF type:complete len:141 (+),score=25.41 TRINITY_DN2161_c0_g2_i3:724-1146(+)
MEEADILCERIGFMTHGKLRCLGPAQLLKKFHGNGYSLELHQLSNQKEKQQYLTEFIKSILPNAVCEEQNQNIMKFKVAFDDVILSEVYQKLEQGKEKLELSYWGISQPSLQDAFLKIVEKYDQFESLNMQETCESKIKN